MKQTWLVNACLGMSLALGAIACGDDDVEDDKVEVDVPGVDVDVKSLSTAGSAAQR